MTNTTPKQGAEQRSDIATPKSATENGAGSPQLFYEERDGKYYALLPSGKRPEIRPIIPPAKLRDIMAAHPRPRVPLVGVQPQGVAIEQNFPNPQDHGYLKALAKWRRDYMAAMMMRCLFDGLVVPDDDGWALLLKLTEVPVPDSGPERVRLYAQEEHPEFWDATKPDEAAAFVAAVQQLTLPSEAGIAVARRRFPDELERGFADGSPPSPGGVSGQPGDGGAESS